MRDTCKQRRQGCHDVQAASSESRMHKWPSAGDWSESRAHRCRTGTILFYGFVHAMRLGCRAQCSHKFAAEGRQGNLGEQRRVTVLGQDDRMRERATIKAPHKRSPRSRRSRSSARCFGCGAMYIAQCKAVIPPRRDWVSMPCVGTASSRHATLPARP